MLKKTSIQPLVDKNARPARTGGAVDHIAAATGIPILILGVVQLVSPFWVAPFTGLEQGAGASILGVLWTVFGALLTLGGLIRCVWLRSLRRSSC
ncbi:MAG: hypothetical protein HC788_04480 [Sphingopyxis sp.]|nr:hypothetical protein [Sphingopyxis sp.]